MKLVEKYNHFSFDLDGTLVHTLPEYRHDVVPRVVSELGGTVKDKSSIDRFWFESGRDEIIKNCFSLDPAVFWKLFRRKDLPEQRALYTQAYPDAEKSLHFLREKDKLISIVTGAPHWIAKMEIEKLNSAPYDYYLSITDSEYEEKPNPKSFELVMKRLALQEATTTVYIGNSNEDAYYAKNAGVDFIYLERKEHPFALDDYAVCAIHSLDELLIKEI
jgi:HAD superfamily hydrolase (TIGR01549 family)